jgi:tripeptidyl-peptidase-1
MHFSNFAIFGALAAQAAAVPFQTSHVVHERRGYILKAWVKRNKLDARAELPVRIGMTQRNLDKGHDLLMEV